MVKMVQYIKKFRDLVVENRFCHEPGWGQVATNKNMVATVEHLQDVTERLKLYSYLMTAKRS